MPFSDFIQKISQAPSSSVEVLIREDELDYLKNPSQDIENSFWLWFLWISSNAGRQNWRDPVFFKVQSGKITVWNDHYLKTKSTNFDNQNTIWEIRKNIPTEVEFSFPSYFTDNYRFSVHYLYKKQNIDFDFEGKKVTT